MARVNLTIADELLESARAAGLNISRTAAAALEQELTRLARIAEVDRYLADLEAELGPIPAAEAQTASEWADKAFGRQAKAPRTA